MIVLESGSYSVQIRDLDMQKFSLILKIKVDHNMNGVLRSWIQLPHKIQYTVRVGMATVEKIEEFRTFIIAQAGVPFVYIDPDGVSHVVRLITEPVVTERIHRGLLGTATLELEGEYAS